MLSNAFIKMSETKLNSNSDDCMERKRKKLDNRMYDTCGNVILEKASKILCCKVNCNGNGNDENEVQYLESPVKLSDDHREYRTIKLKNGLTALLVSTCQSEKETVLDEAYSEKFAYCSLCINVGNFSDPLNAQGLAHLLEHVITMGSKKYPQENEYDSFITSKWGSNNAYTEHERTTYTFEIPDKYLLPAMDRFANIFIDPLMSKDAVSRERHAVESEFKLSQQLDMWRKEQLKHSFARHNHPAAKFSWGNLITLDKNIDLDSLCLELHKFHKRHYSAHRMTLAVQSARSLDSLEEIVNIYFSDIPVNNLPPDDFSMYKGIESFDSEKFRQLYYIKTVTDNSEIELNWVMPPMQHLYKSKPWEYVSWLFTRKGEGSLLNYLRKRAWCMDLQVNEDVDSFNHTSMYYLLTLTINLYDEGYSNFEEVLNSIFSYINLLKREGVQKRIFDHVSQMRENNFKSYFEEEAENYVEYLSQNMQNYKPSDFIHGYDLIFEYNPEEIQMCLNNLSAENVNIIISSKKLKDSETDKIEPWFQTKYTVKEIPKQWIEHWKSIDPSPEFNLLLKKNSSPTQTSKSINNSTLEGVIPIRLHHKDVEVWYNKISGSKPAQFSMYLHLINPLCYKSASHSAALMTMLTLIVMRTTNDIASSLYVAPSLTGVLVENADRCKTACISQISKFLEMLMKCQTKVDEKVFAFVKQEVLRMYYNFFIDPDNLSEEICQTVITPRYWTAIEKYNALTKMTVEQFLELVENFQKEFYVQCFVKGSVPDEEVLNCVEEAIKPLRTTSSILNNYTDKMTQHLDRGERFCQVKNLNSFDVNTVVSNFYQVNPVSAETMVLLELLLNIMSEPLFHILRTKEQLGYKVVCRRCFYQGILCIVITITTQADKFTAYYIDERIENFVRQFESILMTMTSDEFKNIKENYIRLKHRTWLEGNTEGRCIDWLNITCGTYIFRRWNHEVEITRNIKLEDLIQCFRSYMVPGPNYKKLSIQVVGNSGLSSAGEVQEESYFLKYSTEVKEEKKQEKAGCYIEDINTFRNKLNV